MSMDVGMDWVCGWDEGDARVRVRVRARLD